MSSDYNSKKRSKQNSSGSRWTKVEEATLKAAVQAKQAVCSEISYEDWISIADNLGGKRTPEQCRCRWETVLAIGLVKGPWTEAEDKIVMEAVNKGVFRWSEIAERIPGRTGKQCRERYYNHLDEKLNKLPFSPQEDEILLATVAECGTRWKEVSQRMPGRSENAVKNRYYTFARRFNSNDLKSKKNSTSSSASNVHPSRASESPHTHADSSVESSPSPHRPTPRYVRRAAPKRFYEVESDDESIIESRPLSSKRVAHASADDDHPSRRSLNTSVSTMTPSITPKRYNVSEKDSARGLLALSASRLLSNVAEALENVVEALSDSDIDGGSVSDDGLLSPAVVRVNTARISDTQKRDPYPLLYDPARPFLFDNFLDISAPPPSPITNSVTSPSVKNSNLVRDVTADPPIPPSYVPLKNPHLAFFTEIDEESAVSVSVDMMLGHSSERVPAISPRREVGSRSKCSASLTTLLNAGISSSYFISPHLRRDSIDCSSLSTQIVGKKFAEEEMNSRAFVQVSTNSYLKDSVEDSTVQNMNAIDACDSSPISSGSGFIATVVEKLTQFSEDMLSDKSSTFRPVELPISDRPAGATPNEEISSLPS